MRGKCSACSTRRGRGSARSTASFTAQERLQRSRFSVLTSQSRKVANYTLGLECADYLSSAGCLRERRLTLCSSFLLCHPFWRESASSLMQRPMLFWMPLPPRVWGETTARGSTSTGTTGTSMNRPTERKQLVLQCDRKKGSKPFDASWLPGVLPALQFPPLPCKRALTQRVNSKATTQSPL